MGWNTITVKTTLKGPAKDWNSLKFRIGPTRRNPETDQVEMSPVLWVFDNSTDWKAQGDKLVHRSAPTTTEVTHTYQLYFAGFGKEKQKVEKGDYVLSASQYYDSHVPPVTPTLYVNGTPLNSFLGETRAQVVITSLLRKGKNEIKLVGTRVSNVIDWNDITFELGGKAEWSAQQNKFLLQPVQQFKTMTGWVQDKKTGQWHSEANRESTTFERTVEFFLAEDPKANSK
jgi:hypothetical protein